MPLTGSQLEQIHKTIIAAYTREELKQAVRVCMGLSFDDYVSDKGFAAQLWDFIEWAERHSHLKDFVRCSYVKNKGNIELAELWKKANSWDWNYSDTADASVLKQHEAQYFSEVINRNGWALTEGLDNSGDGGGYRPPPKLNDIFVMLEAIERSALKPQVWRQPLYPPRGDIAPIGERWMEMGLQEHSDQLLPADKQGSEAIVFQPPPPPLPISKVLQECLQVVILGEPGTGKSTLLQFLALCYSTPGMVKEKLDLEESKVPVLVTLRSYDGSTQLLDFVSRTVATVQFNLVNDEENRKIARALVDEWFRSGRLIVLLDALDEVTDDSHRGAVLARIEQFAREADTCRIVVTSRIAGYTRAERPGSKIKTYTIRPFTGGEDVVAYAGGWLAALKDTDKEHVWAETEQLVAQAKARPGLSRVLTNPLLLRLLIEVYVENGTLAANRVEVYRRYIEEVLWKRTHAREGHVTSFTFQQVQQGLVCTAWILQTKGPQNRSQIIQHMARMMTGDVDHEKLLKYLQNEIGLVGVYGYENGDLIAFRHLTFQEYLVAQYLVDEWRADIDTAWQEIKPNLHRPQWLEPILLVGHLLGRHEATKLARRILSAGNLYERELRRDLQLAARLIGDRVTLDAEFEKQIADRLVQMTVVNGRAAGFHLEQSGYFRRLLLHPRYLSSFIYFYIDRLWLSASLALPGLTRYLRRAVYVVVVWWLRACGVAPLVTKVELESAFWGMSEPIVPRLPSLYGSSNVAKRIQAVRISGIVEGQTARDIVLAALFDPSAPVVFEAAQTIGSMAPQIPSCYALPRLIEALTEQKQQDWQSSLSKAILKSIDSYQDRIWLYVIEALVSNDHHLRRTAMWLLASKAKDEKGELELTAALTSIGAEIADNRTVKEIATFAPALTDEEPYIRLWAAKVIAALFEESAVPTLAQMYFDPNLDVRKAVAKALGTICSAASVSFLLAHLYDGAVPIVVNDIAAEALATIAKARADSQLFRVVWQRVMKHRGGSERFSFVKFVCESYRDAPALLVEACAAISSPDGSDVYHLVYEAVVSVGNDAIAPLLTKLRFGSPGDQVFAANVLGSIGDSQVVDELMDCLKKTSAELESCGARYETGADFSDIPDEYWTLLSVCEAFIHSLVKLGHTEIVGFLLLRLSPTSVWNQRVIVDALGDAGDQAAVQALIEALRMTNEYLVERMVVALAKLGDARAVPYLIELMSSKSSSIIERCAEALGKLHAVGSIPLLANLLLHENPDIRKAALLGLSYVGESDVISLITPLVFSEDKLISTAACRALSNLGWHAVPELIILLAQAGDQETRFRIADALHDLSPTCIFVELGSYPAAASRSNANEVLQIEIPNQDRVIADLTRLVVSTDFASYTDETIAGAALNSLIVIGAPAVRPILELCDQVPGYTISHFEEALRVISKKASIEQELEHQLLYGRDSASRCVAAALLADTAGERIRHSIELAALDKEYEVRQEVLKILRRIPTEWSRELTVKLCLGDRVPWIRSDAAEVLGDIGDRTTIKALIKASCDPAIAVRANALDALTLLIRKLEITSEHDLRRVASASVLATYEPLFDIQRIAYRTLNAAVAAMGC